ncbi:MAG: RNA-processing protein [Candidatus Diapherotrites archaeon]|nr:RNA-processing protein [Candidatus Diapherotrites archaeon]
MEYEDYLFVPKERIGVLIGEKGEIKKEIEKKANVILHINSKTGEVNVERDEDTDPVMAMKAEDVIKAIARGFNPKIAMKLFEEGYYLEILDLRDYLNSKKAIERQKARIIGAKGKARKTLEDLTGASISIYGKTVAVIGKEEEVQLAVDAIEKLLSGTPHGDVYRAVQIRRRDLF